MRRVSLLRGFVPAVAIILLLSAGLFASDQPKGSNSAAKTKTPAKNQGTAKTTSRGTSSGSTKAESTAKAPVPAPNVADEAKSVRMVKAESSAPVGEYNGSVVDLPQIPVTEMPELDLLEPNIVSKRITMAAQSQDAVSKAPTRLAPAPTMNFDGMSYLDNYCVGGQCGAGHPPDTTGAVGINHYIEGINMAYAVYDKTTGARLAAFTENALWSGQGPGTPCNINNFGDPIVVYDQTADRWILTHFAFALNGSGNPIAPYYQCFAVSKSGDPVNGGWWFYAVQMDQSPVPATTLNDYPKFGNWNDGCLYMGSNGFLNAGSYNGEIVASFNKNDMYNGLPLNFALAFLSGTANFGLFPVSMLGKGGSLPSPTTSAYFVGESQTAFAFNVRTVTAGSCRGGGTVSAITVVAQTSYSVPGQNIVPQPPPATTNNRLDSLGDRMMQWNWYRKVGSAESLWVSHTTRTNTTSNTSPQWAQINVTGGTIATTPVQQQIFRPDTTLYRWMSSIGVDNAGNMALGYSTSNATSPNFPSVVYSGRLVTDPLNTLPQGETTIIAGLGSGVFNCGGAACHRWGDYSSMTVDPNDDCTFWYTNMYYNGQANGTLGNHQTRIASFKYPSCTAVLPVLAISKSHNGNFTQSQIGATYALTVTNNGPGYTFGTVTVTDALPAGLTATSIAGSGWTCTLATLTCTRADNIASGSSYPAITLTVNVANNAPAQVTNSATVSGGGSASSVTVADLTTINPQTIVCGTVQTTTAASLIKLGNGSYQATLTVVNNGTGTAQNVKLSAATLGVPSGTPLPQSLGNIPPGGFATTTVAFPSSAGVSGTNVVEKYSGTYTACPTSGSFGASIRATLP